MLVPLLNAGKFCGRYFVSTCTDPQMKRNTAVVAVLNGLHTGVSYTHELNLNDGILGL